MKPTLTFNFNTVEELMEFCTKLQDDVGTISMKPQNIATMPSATAPVTRYAKGYNGELPSVPSSPATPSKKKKLKTLSLEEAAPEVAPIEEEEIEVEEKSSISVKEITKDECRELLVQVSEKVGMPSTLELLKDFGAKKFGEVSQDKYPEFKEKCLSILK